MPNYVQQNGTQSTLPVNGAQISQVYSHVAIGEYGQMSTLSPALKAISTDPPAVEVTAVAEVVARQYDLRGNYEPLVSERDQNFSLRIDDGRRFVVKIVSRAEDAEATDFQIGLLQHLQQTDDVIVPAVVPTLGGTGSGEFKFADARYRVRIVSWVEGEPLEAGDLDATQAWQFGAALARLGEALQDYAHPGENRALAWDLQRIVELSSLVENIDDDAIRTAVSGAIHDYEHRVLPAKANLPTQVIHGDANPGNVLAGDDGIAFIDFGDGVRAPRVFDLAIAASYLRTAGEDPLLLIAPFVGGYQSVSQLDALELDLVFDLVRARLAITITLLYWRLSARDDDDPYRQKTLELEKSAAVFLRKLDDFGREKFFQKIR